MERMEPIFCNRLKSLGVFIPLLCAVLPLCGCVSQNRLAYERAVFAREYRILEDELYRARQDLKYLSRVNEKLLRETDGETTENDGVFSGGKTQRNGKSSRSAAPTIAPIIDEDAEPSLEYRTDDIEPLENAPKFNSGEEDDFTQHRRTPRGRTNIMQAGSRRTPVGDYEYVETPELSPRPMKPVGRTEIQNLAGVEEQQILLWTPQR